MHEYQLPEKILFNYEELKRELTEKYHTTKHWFIPMIRLRRPKQIRQR